MITIPEDIETVLPREATKLLQKQRIARENMSAGALLRNQQWKDRLSEPSPPPVVVFTSEDDYESRWHMQSERYTYYYTKKEADTATENIVFNRMAYNRERAEELLERLKEVCDHKSIDGQGKCIRCELRVPNPDSYNSGIE